MNLRQPQLGRAVELGHPLRGGLGIVAAHLADGGDDDRAQARKGAHGHQRRAGQDERIVGHGHHPTAIRSIGTKSERNIKGVRGLAARPGGACGRTRN